MTTQYGMPQNFINFLLNGWGGSGNLASNAKTSMARNGSSTVGNRNAQMMGFNPGGTPTGWEGQDTSRAGNVGLNTSFSTGVSGGAARTQTSQSILDTPKAKATSHWIVNDLAPTKDGKAVADVTQVLDVANKDGSTTQIGKNRQIAFEGKPVVKSPSNVQWSSSSFRLKYDSNNGMDLAYNKQNSDGDATDLGTKVYREGDTWVNDTRGTRVDKNGLSTLDGLGAYSPTTPTKTFNDSGLMDWLGQQFNNVNSWSNNGNLVQTV